ncbi:hypothetical protein PHMEG_00013101 [Phytophthora megakarya]|uniref:Reverse transcriptase n=1 Tax=Phytophthora megakarya TaxID=4795 RepID=A0A225W7J6_9STRA|nr:hypothetical protein PHMEG_00013101 [Phytophthora megakarya]
MAHEGAPPGGTRERLGPGPPSKAKKRRAEDHNRKWKQLTDRLKDDFEVGDSVWLYLARVRPRLTKKLAHIWHGPFWIREKGSDFRYCLQVEGMEYLGPR